MVNFGQDSIALGCAKNYSANWNPTKTSPNALSSSAKIMLGRQAGTWPNPLPARASARI
jgi:hypothetical protein